jgi:hypothetical protein
MSAEGGKRRQVAKCSCVNRIAPFAVSPVRDLSGKILGYASRRQVLKGSLWRFG